MNSSYFRSDFVGIAQRRNGTLSPRYQKETHSIRNCEPFAIATHARRCVFSLLSFFHPLRIFRGRFRENEWILYPELNLKHGRNGVRKAWRLGIISAVIAMLRQNFYKNCYSPMEINVVRIKTGISTFE